MSQLSITNVITVTVATPQIGLNAYNTGNLLLITDDAAGGTFPASGYQFYKDPSQVATDFGTGSTTYKMAVAVFSQQPNILTAGGSLIIATKLVSIHNTVTVLSTVIQFFGVMSTEPYETMAALDFTSTATIVQGLNKLFFAVTTTEVNIQPGGVFFLNTTNGNTHTRCLFYTDASSGAINALLFQAGYASRGLATDFNGSLTTGTMHLKQLSGVPVDPALTQGQLTEAIAAGVDVYASFQGVPGVFSTGANLFFDQIDNLLWLSGALQVSAFNFLATTNTKVPQTEQGMDAFKGSGIRPVMDQAVTNGYSAPGQWTSPTIFGNAVDFFANIAQRGYYVFSPPVAQQTQANRVARVAPTVQIALKEAGAIHSGNIIVFINP